MEVLVACTRAEVGKVEGLARRISRRESGEQRRRVPFSPVRGMLGETMADFDF